MLTDELIQSMSTLTGVSRDGRSTIGGGEMRAAIKSFFWVDVEPGQVEANTVEAQFVIASLEVGAVDGPGGELFYAEFATLHWLDESLKRDSVVSGRHRYFVESIDLAALRTFLEKTVTSIEGETWSEIATQLARVMMWEFEDYVPHPSFG